MDNIGDILGKLSSEDMEALQNAAQELLGSGGFSLDGFQDKNGQEDNYRQNTGTDSSAPDFSSMLNADVMAKVARLMGAMNQKDSRCDLINALKPHLSQPRRQKADQAMQMIKLLDMLPLLENLK